jgi:probable molybdenum cofactor biosynthesis protein A
MKEIHEFRLVITPFCNYGCFFCHGEGLTKEHTPLMLTAEDYGFVLSAGHDVLGWDTTTITGGEPLLSPNFRKIVDQAINANVRITVVTNASLLTHPSEVLQGVNQVNISLHSTQQDKYTLITQTTYPVCEIMDAIIRTRVELPKIDIHLNNTIVKGINDSVQDFEAMINFAKFAKSEAKFIDLVTSDQDKSIPVSEIINRIFQLGYKVVDTGIWQTVLEKDNNKVYVTRCGFGRTSKIDGIRSIFLNPDGTLSTDCKDDIPVDVLGEIKCRNREMFIKKVNLIFA